MSVSSLWNTAHGHGHGHSRKVIFNDFKANAVSVSVSVTVTVSRVCVLVLLPCLSPVYGTQHTDMDTDTASALEIIKNDFA